MAAALYSSSGRMPKQTRGRERREALIDAAAALIAEVGEEALSLHAVARRSGTSIGSVYHFFGSRDQLLHAILERHRDALIRITEPLRDIPLERWQSMSPGDVIRTLYGPPLRYLTAHRDALVVQHHQDANLTIEFQRLLLTVMQARLGVERGSRVAATLYAVATGILFHLHEAGGAGELGDDVPIEQVLVILIENAAAL